MQASADECFPVARWLTQERLRVYPRLLALVYLVVSIGWFAQSREGIDPAGKVIGQDFIVFWAASDLVLEGDAPGVYDPSTLSTAERREFPAFEFVLPWQYPPTYLLLVAPLALLPYYLSCLLFLGGSLFALLVVLRQIAPPRIGMLLTVVFPGIFLNAIHGQNGFLTAALIGAGLLWLPSRPLLAGMMFGLLTIKPHLALLIPVALIAGRRWSALASAAVVSIALLGVSVAVLGADTIPAFFRRVQAVSIYASGHQPMLWKMPTCFALLRLLEVPMVWAYASQIVLALVVAATVALVWARCGEHELRAATLVAGSLLMSPYLLDYDLVWLCLTIAWFLKYALREGWQRGEQVWLLIAWMLPLVIIVLHAGLHMPLGFFVLSGLFAMVVRRAVSSLRSGQGPLV